MADLPTRDELVAEAAIRNDYELLAAAAKRNAWNANTPVPPDFFCPLWPHAPLPWFQPPAPAKDCPDPWGWRGTLKCYYHSPG